MGRKEIFDSGDDVHRLPILPSGFRDHWGIDGVLHAGTRRRDDGAVVSSGGRVLSVVGTGESLEEARADAYRRIDGIKLPGAHWRTDIGLAAVEGRVAAP